MRIDKYGILLESLTLETSEIVRVWRNNPEINEFMDYRENISAEQQKAWFSKIQNENSNYFLISKEQHPIGMIHVEKIDTVKLFGSVGLFIGDKKYHGTGVALAASLNLLEYVFDSLNLKLVYAKVKNDNLHAIKYNEFLGFEKAEKIDNHFSLWKLTKENFELNKKSILKILSID